MSPLPPAAASVADRVISGKLSVPVYWKIRNIPIRNPKSPIRLVMNAFFPARGVRRVLVPETDQQVAAEADALPADEHHRQAVAEDQHQHRPAEQVQVGEEARVVGVMRHVPRGVDVNQEADEGDDQAEQPRQPVEPERQIDLERTGGDPGADGVVQPAPPRPPAAP